MCYRCQDKSIADRWSFAQRRCLSCCFFEYLNQTRIEPAKKRVIHNFRRWKSKFLWNNQREKLPFYEEFCRQYKYRWKLNSKNVCFVALKGVIKESKLCCLVFPKKSGRGQIMAILPYHWNNTYLTLLDPGHFMASQYNEMLFIIKLRMIVVHADLCLEFLT